MRLLKATCPEQGASLDERSLPNAESLPDNRFEDFLFKDSFSAPESCLLHFDMWPKESAESSSFKSFS